MVTETGRVDINLFSALFVVFHAASYWSAATELVPVG